MVLGAYGAHGLSGRLTESQLGSWHTAANYQLIHAVILAVVALALRGNPIPSGWLLTSGYAFALGILLFSGSIYLLTLGGPRWLGPITPIGGTGFIIGWACLLIAALKV